ncbi:MAG: hypothetical protein DRQ42_05260 [Gammaproteobacteria bacterium]|nr:MAG: hypothetical protein DRQ42_05260 [Gammaproteobacteria bacterium]
MKQLCDIYGKRFFGKRHKLHWRAPHVCKAIDDVLHPTSVVDVGCATGDLVDCWQHNFGVEAMGIEGDKSAEEFLVTDNIWFYDMRVSNEYSFTFDLCTCLEVAEHIEPEYASIFVKNLVDLSDKILTSCAPPGQGGHHHVNCQPLPYWIYIFESFGYTYQPLIVDDIKKGWEPWRKKDGIRAFDWNLAYFEKENG